MQLITFFFAVMVPEVAGKVWNPDESKGRRAYIDVVSATDEAYGLYLLKHYPEKPKEGRPTRNAGKDMETSKSWFNERSEKLDELRRQMSDSNKKSLNKWIDELVGMENIEDVESTKQKKERANKAKEETVFCSGFFYGGHSVETAVVV